MFGRRAGGGGWGQTRHRTVAAQVAESWTRARGGTLGEPSVFGAVGQGSWERSYLRAEIPTRTLNRDLGRCPYLKDVSEKMQRGLFLPQTKWNGRFSGNHLQGGPGEPGIRWSAGGPAWRVSLTPPSRVSGSQGVWSMAPWASCPFLSSVCLLLWFPAAMYCDPAQMPLPFLGSSFTSHGLNKSPPSKWLALFPLFTYFLSLKNFYQFHSWCACGHEVSSAFYQLALSSEKAGLFMKNFLQICGFAPSPLLPQPSYHHRESW